MTTPRPALRELAQRMLADEAELRDEPAIAVAEAEVVFARLRDRLVGLIGEHGFEAILARSLKLAKAEAPALERVSVTKDGRLAGLTEALGQRAPADAIEAPACLLAHFLELLASFIGTDLTSHLAGTVERERGRNRGRPEET